MRIDIHESLTTSIQPAKVLIVLLASCLLWVSGISLAVIGFAGSSVSIGWIVVGALVLALLVWLVVMSREILRTFEVPDYFAADAFENAFTPVARNRQAGIRGADVSGSGSAAPAKESRETAATIPPRAKSS